MRASHFPEEVRKPSPLSQRSDSELVVLVADNGSGALDELYWRYASQLLRLAFTLLRSRDDAEDVVQDVFVGLPLAIGHYVERGAFAGWLRLLATHTALMHLRRRASRRTDSLDAETNLRPVQPDSVLERIDLESAIASLPEPLRIVFVLARVEQLSHNEIAGLLGIRRGTSEVRLHRAIRRLRDYLEEKP